MNRENFYRPITSVETLEDEENNALACIRQLADMDKNKFFQNASTDENHTETPMTKLNRLKGEFDELKTEIDSVKKDISKTKIKLSSNEEKILKEFENAQDSLGQVAGAEQDLKALESSRDDEYAVKRVMAIDLLADFSKVAMETPSGTEKGSKNRK